MSLVQQARMATSVASSVATTLGYTLIKNAAFEAARLPRRQYPGVADTTFDPFDPETAADPYPQYRELLSGARVHYNRRRKFFLISRYDDVRAAARNDAALSNADGVTRSRTRLPGVLLNMDPPRHTELRRKVQPAFARGALSSWQSKVDTLAHDLVSSLLANPGSDMVAHLAVPLPVQMIAHILGIPREDYDFFRHWSNECVRVANIEFTPSGIREMAHAINGTRQLHSYFFTEMRTGRLLESDTALGRLVTSNREGDLSREELFYFALLLLLAGNETTTNLLSTMFFTLAQHPDQFELIRRNPDTLLASAIEEQLRFSSPIQNFYRTAKTDYRLGDAVIPAGSRVALLWGAANRDPRQFDNPDSFLAERNPSHVAFGSGVHLCLGAGLARMEAKAVLRELVEQIERIDVDGAPSWTTNSSLRGLEELRVTLTPLRPTP